MSTGERDCQHLCCDDRGNPFHDHYLPPEQCPRCEQLRDQSTSNQPQGGGDWVTDDQGRLDDGHGDPL